uniref:Mediator of RNA polymerase II transcription subunit 31 n=1 Tax=Ornithorhynchus anatinus TaxID=9258 RepID=A0A6I8PPC3_ORNAN
MAGAVAMETDDAGNRLRFQLELEFVQCLANPNYLNCILSACTCL